MARTSPCSFQIGVDARIDRHVIRSHFGENRSRSRIKVRDLVFFPFIRVFGHERMKHGKDLSGRNLESPGKSRMIFLNACFYGIPRGRIKSLIKLTDSISYLSDPNSKPPPPPRKQTMCQGRCQRKCERFGLEKPIGCSGSRVTSLTVSAERATTNEAPDQPAAGSMIFPTKIVELSLNGDTARTPDLLARSA